MPSRAPVRGSAPRPPVRIDRNRRREGSGLITFVFPATPLRLELAGLALQAFEGVEGLLTVVRPAHPAIDPGEDVVIGRGARVGGDGAGERGGSLVQLSLMFGRPAFLEPGS